MKVGKQKKQRLPPVHAATPGWRGLLGAVFITNYGAATWSLGPLILVAGFASLYAASFGMAAGIFFFCALPYLPGFGPFERLHGAIIEHLPTSPVHKASSFSEDKVSFGSKAISLPLSGWRNHLIVCMVLHTRLRSLACSNAGPPGQLRRPRAPRTSCLRPPRHILLCV